MNKTKQSVRCEVMKQHHEFLIQEDESDSKERHVLKNRAKEILSYRSEHAERVLPAESPYLFLVN